MSRKAEEERERRSTSSSSGSSSGSDGCGGGEGSRPWGAHPSPGSGSPSLWPPAWLGARATERTTSSPSRRRWRSPLSKIQQS